MGYLDNSTIVVDAVLTKQGRKLLALGQGLNVAYFTLTDTGVDYTLWNPDHPSGSAYYGEAIENMPNLEALPNSAYFMRNNLLSWDRDLVAMPYVVLGTAGIGKSFTETFSTPPDPLSFTIALENTSAGETSGWQVVVPDSSLIDIEAPWVASPIGGAVQTYLNEQEILNAVVYEAAAGTSTITINRQNTLTQRSLLLTFISRSTGAYKHASLVLPQWPIL